MAREGQGYPRWRRDMMMMMMILKRLLNNDYIDFMVCQFLLGDLTLPLLGFK